MPKAKPSTRGRDLSARLREGIALAGRALRPGARDLPVLTGLSPKCIAHVPLENVLAAAAAILAASGVVYARGDAIELEVVEEDGRRLVPLARGGEVEASAAARLANLFVCEQPVADERTIQFAPPRNFVAVLLNSAPLRGALPPVKTYATRPVFDEEFRLLGPGWHPDQGVLVHGPAVEPVEPPEPDITRPILERLPHHLRTLLGGFCFRAAADVANAVAALLTALLVVRYVARGKPLVLLDGTQPGLGKTLLARVLGALLDGRDPALLHYTADDEELGKRICATLRGGQSLVLIDNAKVRGGAAISSPVLEANSMAPQVALRILGQSANYSRPNDLLWALTMNDTRTSPDLVSRGLPIRLHYEGDPRLREFAGPDPATYALEQRAALLGEMAGMVVRWNRLGRPAGAAQHRCKEWARELGGILQVAGLPEFLENLDEAAALFNMGLDELAALAEAAVAGGGPAVVAAEVEADAGAGLLATEWEALFRAAGVQVDELEGVRSQRSKATLLGTFLSRNVGREVTIEVDGRAGAARLRAVDAGKRQRRYSFAIAWVDGPPPASAPAHVGVDGAPSAPTDAPGRPRSCPRRQPDGTRARPTPSAPATEPRPPPSGVGNDEDWEPTGPPRARPAGGPPRRRSTGRFIEPNPFGSRNSRRFPRPVNLAETPRRIPGCPRHRPGLMPESRGGGDEVHRVLPDHQVKH